MAVKLDGLADAIAEALEEFQEESMDEVKTSTKRAAKTCVEALVETSPKRKVKGGRRQDPYNEGWRAKVAYESPLDIRVQVYNKTNYQLTHLLEDGHAKVNGGTVPGTPHIEPAAEKASQLLLKDINIKVGKK